MKRESLRNIISRIKHDNAVNRRACEAQDGRGRLYIGTEGTEASLSGAPRSKRASEALVTHHVHHLWVNGLGDDAAVVGDELHHLAERRPLHLLPFQVTEGVGQEIKENAALTQLLDEELLLLGRSHI